MSRFPKTLNLYSGRQERHCKNDSLLNTVRISVSCFFKRQKRLQAEKQILSHSTQKMVMFRRSFTPGRAQAGTGRCPISGQSIRQILSQRWEVKFRFLKRKLASWNGSARKNFPIDRPAEVFISQRSSTGQLTVWLWLFSFYLEIL